MDLGNLGSKKTQKGSQSTETVTDSGVIELMKEVLVELKLMNAHLAEMTDLDIEPRDVKHDN